MGQIEKSTKTESHSTKGNSSAQLNVSVQKADGFPPAAAGKDFRKRGGCEKRFLYIFLQAALIAEEF